jgi:tetratricopeptide (TPR) repeat protein
VLEHHSETRIVTIDLGRQVNLTAGQELLVFHPDFTGHVSFIHKDGRTEKRLGTYPRVACGRVEVFDVQTEISFCKVTEMKDIKLFPVGSILEAVPVGTITHLLASDDMIQSADSLIGDPNRLEDAVQRILKEGDQPLACVFALRNTNEIVEQRGTAFVNKTLAALYSAIFDYLPSSAIIGQISPDQFGAVLREVPETFNKSTSEILFTLRETFSNIPVVVCGVFSAENIDPVHEHDFSELSLDNCLNYARYAASALDDKEKPVGAFSAEVAEQVLYKSRSNGLHDIARRDYEAFKKLGVSSAFIENQYGLVCFGDRDYLAATDAFEEAIKLAPRQTVLWANAGIAFSKLGDRIESYNRFLRVLELDADFQWAEVYLPDVALSFYEHYLKYPSDENRELVEGFLQEARKTPSGMLDQPLGKSLLKAQQAIEADKM